MSDYETITRVYRETVAAQGLSGNRSEAIESGISTMQVEIRAGRFAINEEDALRAMFRKVDESDGRTADAILKRAAMGDIPLVTEDLDVVVTLGGGARKVWRDVTPADLKAMNDIRFKNYTQTRDSYAAFNAAYLAVREVVLEHGTFGDAFDAGGFPPADQKVWAA